MNMRELIHESGHHLLAVVNGILDMSKIETGNFHIVAEPFAVKGLVESCRSMMLLKAETLGRPASTPSSSRASRRSSRTSAPAARSSST